jgi:phosphomannomutase
MGAVGAAAIFDRLPVETVRMYFELDGTFPNHPADPLIEANRRDVVERVRAEEADLGIARDADRCFFVDDTGAYVPGDSSPRCSVRLSPGASPARRSSTTFGPRGPSPTGSAPPAGLLSYHISVDYDEWHFNVRPSNTEALLRLNLEAGSRGDMERRRDEVLGVIRS